MDGRSAAQKSPDAFESIRTFLASGLCYKALRQSVDRVPLAVADDVAVDPEGYTDVAMAELIPHHGDRGSTFDQFRCDGMADRMKTHASYFQGLKQGS